MYPRRALVSSPAVRYRAPATAAAAVLLASAAGPGGPAVEREVLLSLAPGEMPADLAATPDLAHWIAMASVKGPVPDAEKGRRIFIDGRDAGLYDHVPRSRIFFSDDGSHVAYVTVSWGSSGLGSYRVHLDGHPVGDPGLYAESIEVGRSLGPWLSPGGHHIAHLGLWKGSEYLVLDGKVKKGSGHDRVIMDRPWLPDGRFDHVVEDGGDQTLLVNHKPVQEADRIRVLAQSPVLAWIARTGSEERFTSEAGAGPAWASIGEVACRPAGGCAYAATDGAGRTLVVTEGGTEGPWEEASGLVFSPSGDLAYVARSPEGSVLVLGGVHGRAWKSIDRLAFLDDGRAAMVARDGARRQLVIADRTGACLEVASFAGVHSMTPGPGGRLALGVLEAGSARLWIDGSLVGPEADEVRHCSVSFSPSGSHAAAALRSGERDLVIVDGETVGSWDRVGCPLILQDDRLVFLAWTGSSLERVTVAVSP